MFRKNYGYLVALSHSAKLILSYHIFVLFVSVADVPYLGSVNSSDINDDSSNNVASRRVLDGSSMFT